MRNLLKNLVIAANTKKQCEADLVNIEVLHENLSKLREAASKGETFVWINLIYSINQNVIDEARRITGCDVKVASYCNTTLEISWKE